MAGCGDVLSLEDLQTAKKHQIFEAEVITGKVGGVAGGATIDTATNPVTGQTQQTLPSILADLGFDVQSWTSSTGGVLASANQVFLNDTPGSLGLGEYYAWVGTFPKTVPAGTDPALPGRGYIMRSSRFAGTQAREALRRSYAESGRNLVDGSFEAGGTLVNANDVLLQERTGKAFSGPAGAVVAGTNPASGGFVNVSGAVHGIATVAKINSGMYGVGATLTVSDRANGIFSVVSGGTPNGFDILNAGNGNTAVLQSSGWLNALACGFSPLQTAAFNVGAFNRAMAISRFVYVLKSSGEYLVDSTIDNNIQVPSNTFLFFEPGTTLRSTDNAATDYRVICINNVENVTIYNGIFRGDKDTHLGVAGEGGHAIGCYSSNNVKLYDCQGHDSWGVGLAIIDCNDFYAENIWCDNGRQNSAAIVSGTNVKLLNPTFSNASGTAPSAGLDIEPNTSTDRLENIQIINPRTYGNAGAGIQISLGFWAGGSNDTDITITNHVDRGSLNAFWVSQLQDGGTGGNDGVIKYIKGVAFDTKETSILVSNYSALRSPRILIDTPTVYRPNAVGGALVTQFAGIALERASAFANTNKLGNIHIKNPTVVDNRTTKKMVQAISVSDFKGVGYQDTIIEDPVKLDGVTSGSVNDLVRFYSGVMFSDKFGACSRNLTTSTVFGGTSALGEITNIGATSLIGFTLPASQTLETSNTVRFTNFETTGLRIMPSAAARILPTSSVAGKYIQTTELGASIALVRRGVNDWYVKEIVGTWSVQP